MTLCRWSPCRWVHPCSQDRKDIISCRISLRMPWVHSQICCFESSVLAGHVPYTLLFAWPQRKWLGTPRSGKRAGRLMSAKWEMSLPGNHVLQTCMEIVCCVSSCSKHDCVWWLSVWKRHLVGKLVFKFKMPSGISGTPTLPAHLILQCQTTSFGAMSGATYMERVLPILMT